MISSFSAVIDALSGPKLQAAHFARSLIEVDPKAGITASRAAELKRRDYLPPALWPAVVALAKREGVEEIDHAALARILAARSEQDGRRKRVSA